MSLPTTPNAPGNTRADDTPLPLLRYFIFTLACFGTVFAIWGLASLHGTRLFHEGSPLEWIQFGTLVSTACIFLLAARRITARREILILLATVALLGSIRELDAYFDKFMPSFGWQLPFFGIGVPAVVLAWKVRARLAPQLRALAAHRASVLMWGATMLAIPFGQMIGHGDFLESLLGDNYHRSMKRIVEESSETMGYLWILLASVDWTLDLRAKAQSS